MKKGIQNLVLLTTLCLIVGVMTNEISIQERPVLLPVANEVWMSLLLLPSSKKALLFAWPIDLQDYIALSSPFGERDPQTVGGLGDDFHNGLDLFGTYRARIRACTDATVACVFPAPNGYYRGHTALGGLVILQAERQGDTFLFVHGHLSEVEVIEGATVAAGDLLGRQGNTGRSDGEHLHFGINQNGTLNTATGEITGGVWLNPLKYITEPGENNEKTR